MPKKVLCGGSQGGPGTDAYQFDHCKPQIATGINKQGKVDLAYYISYHMPARPNYAQGKKNHSDS